MTTYTLLLGNMTPPAPGALPASRFSAQATPPDGAGPVGPDQYWPQPLTVSFDNLLSFLGIGQSATGQNGAGQNGAGQNGAGQTGNGPTSTGQNVPAAGTNGPRSIDDIIPPTIRLAGAVALGAAQGNPATAFVSILTAFAVKIVSLGPDTSGPAARPGFTVCGDEAGYQPVAPTPGDGQAPSGVMTMADWQAGQYLEKGVV